MEVLNGLKWQERGNYKLTFPKTYGSKGIIQTLQKNDLNWEGVKIFNCLPLELRSFKGTSNAFKNKLDCFLELIPDQPEVDSIKSGARHYKEIVQTVLQTGFDAFAYLTMSLMIN